METETVKISKEEALKLLFGEFEKVANQNVFDVYGNYQFPTDITVSEPNIAIGTSESVIYNK